MSFKVLFFTAASVLIAFSACKMAKDPGPEIVGPEPIPWSLIGMDSITTGTFMGLTIGASSEEVYAGVQQLQETKGVTYLNVVSTESPDIRSLESRIPLYSYILLDEQRGTDRGVQISLEKGKVSAIFLNSGKKLSRWPEKGNVSVSMGDTAENLYAKLLSISKLTSHASRFERVSLRTKDLSRAYDPIMSASPQWYFAYLEGEKQLHQVQIFLKDGIVSAVVYSRMVKPD